MRKARMFSPDSELDIHRENQEQQLMESLFQTTFSFTPSSENTLYILHTGPTNSGKTYQALQRLKETDNGLYMAPLRLLALEIFHTLNEERAACHLKTGEEERFVNGARITSCTIEVANLERAYEIAVIDEAQLIADRDRGFSWYQAITKIKAREVHIISASSAVNLLLHLLKGKHVQVKEYERSVPLCVEKKRFRLKDTQTGDALIVFSRNRVLQTAAFLEQQGHKASVVYGSMPPETR
ncbi:DEAD/DEAH box helicase [Ectobacillus panaciterrae]|uniref:DEAD/DEAH box helicase n=1 Tax=Ectobacillus panaciterrae TaxID=363872 RepID=UPI00048D61AA|nr:DEAD/DEAH box helicase [Ectobacillus panaciterrae]